MQDGSSKLVVEFIGLIGEKQAQYHIDSAVIIAVIKKTTPKRRFL